MEGVKYLGKKTSRKALLGSDLEAHSAEDGEGSESEEEDDKDEDAMEGTTEEKHSNEGGLEDKKRERIRQRAQEDEDGQQQTGSESEHEDERADMAEGDLLENEEIKALDKEYQQILHQEEEMLQTVRSRSAVDYKKAHAVANQRMLWDKALELCILCQRLLSIGNRLPQPVAWPIIRGASEEASTKFKDVSKAAAEALSVTLDLEKTLLERNEAILAARGSAELTGLCSGRGSICRSVK
ncbi:hypothetical protein CBR_g1068 [Chara braunii]|uniref:AATF leucine zipper-containing domain-containing protein n=1 Tax=Chara braunii TaxID=69332 RepID=A0A388KD27_CHABU|nr:hypothetical protein CBR_g1068 [Chara braunii]|eukprot:GBG67949.1 hypothetical protein CBR_g1068 [Chara braunii]